MDRRTLEIIIVCKGYTRYDSDFGLVDCVRNYMSDKCKCDKELYTMDKMETILKEAFYDFIDVCDRPSHLLKMLDDTKKYNVNLSCRICMVLQNIQVCTDGKYINGFPSDYDKIAEGLR